ncbi:hypothetical protein ACFYUY_01620 [Kitasatospora sp. NPDC004745]|uniref:hypothetical protein n=1 Tax=Kitasatospora sp. NPDC004745 TaxID=3364019 RepID=UPI0036ABAF18
MSVTVTPSDLRSLRDSGAEDPVLYVNFDVDEEPELDVWAGAHVDNDHVVITRAALEDWLGDDWADGDIREYLPELQETADGIIAEHFPEPPSTHFTVWVVNDTSSLGGDNCEVEVKADAPHTYYEGDEKRISWESTGDPLLQHVTSVDARDGDIDDAIREAEELLEAAGWRIAGRWDAVDTAYIAEVERSDPDETWTLQQAADHMGADRTDTASKALRRLGVEAVGRAPGRGGQSIYSAVEVMYAHATRPGRGARTDLKDAE